MKNIISIILLVLAAGVSVLFTAKQFSCTQETCGYSGVKEIRARTSEIKTALTNSQAIEKKRELLNQKYNSITIEDKQKLEALVPNNVDNIKLVLEIETLANKYGVSISSPRLKIAQDVPADVAKDATGQAIRQNQNDYQNTYGSFVLDFGVRTNYQNLKNLIRDMERNLRLIEITSIEIKVPEGIDPNTKRPYPNGIYDVQLQATIYYLKK